MSLENARQFVAIMRQNEAFRTAARKAVTAQQLETFLQDHDYGFKLHHLVMSMAECMDEMARGCTQSG